VTVPYVEFPDPMLILLQLLRTSTHLPSELQPDGKVCTTLPDVFPEGLPYLQVTQVSGGRRVVPLRLAAAQFDLNVYGLDIFQAATLATKITALVVSLEQKSTNLGGFTRIDLTGDPFPTMDPGTDVERYVIPVTATYRAK
jgi:hypothetical protein